MVLGFLTVLIQGTLLNGGPSMIWERANNGSRLTIFDFDVDPLRRHTFWTIAIGGTFTWLGIYGVNQSTMQRCISCRSEKQAKLALYLNLVGLWIILVCAVFSGLVMYAHYKNCDPWTAGFISAPDQLMPYFVMDIFSSIPGLPGLFVACAFSGTLSTVAASINALATVTFEDFVKNCLPNLSENMSTWVSKGLCRYSRCKWEFFTPILMTTGKISPNAMYPPFVFSNACIFQSFLITSLCLNSGCLGRPFDWNHISFLGRYWSFCLSGTIFKNPSSGFINSQLHSS
uniref:Solute carrier family 5 member 12 n=1 Tax=Crocodylus porosus TaxID=8502 RepID=A0A7M4FVG3_CROPO